MDKDKDCFNGLIKILIFILIPIFVGYIIFEIEKMDTIRAKKMESFEIIFNNFNDISQRTFAEDKISLLNFIYNTVLINLDFNKGNTDFLETQILELKINQLKVDKEIKDKKLELEIEILVNKIHHHENLLKSYYGYSRDDVILPILKMLWIIDYSKQLDKNINNSLMNIVEEIRTSLLTRNDKIDIKEAKKIVEEIAQKINNWLLNNKEILITKEKLNILFKEESFKLSEHIYNAHTQELNTPLFKLYLNKNKKTTSNLIYPENIRTKAIEDINKELSLENLNIFNIN